MSRARPSTKARGYGAEHRHHRRRVQEIVASGRADCVRCGRPILPGEAWDLDHADDDRSFYLGPAHASCNRRAGRKKQWWTTPRKEVDAEPQGLSAEDERWRVPWLDELREIPANAVWPRLMTVPHPLAVDSLGGEFHAWTIERVGRELRWWQQLVATRLLEIDEAGALVWDTMILSLSRQLGKSWLLRELMLWRIHQGERFGEPQDVMHTGKDVAVCKEIQRPARVWARGQADAYKVREVNGQEEIQWLGDGSRWMIRAKDAVYGYAASCGAVDEAWKVRAAAVEDGLVPTMAERVQPQLWLVSTAHRLATGLMLSRRKVALGELETGEGDLLIEWSAPRRSALEDRDGWRDASPHWTPKRERLIARQLESLRAGELNDPEEPDPEQSFRAQWLNQWPRKVADAPTNTVELLPPGQWTALGEAGLASEGPLWVALEDDFGRGACVAAATRLEDERIEVDGWLCDDWDSAIRDVKRLGKERRIRHLLVGASLLSRVPPGTSPPPEPVGTRETRRGLPLLRDLAANRLVVHDAQTVELDEALASAHVKETTTGLVLASRGPTHLVRAVVWALLGAHMPSKVPAIH